MEKLVDPWDEFDPDHREAVVGLSFLGKLTDHFSWCGHTFTLRTLKPAEKAAIARVVEPYQMTLQGREIFNNAHVSMALVSIDEDDTFCPPVGPDLESFARARLNWVTGDMNTDPALWQPALEYLYSRYLELELRAAKAAEALQDFCLGGQTPSSHFARGTTDKDSSAEPTSPKSRRRFSIGSSEKKSEDE